MADYSFQQDAIDSICRAYSEKINGKYLLVIPTGGGKTLTAIRAVNALLDAGVFNESSTVVWVQHLLQLKNQTQRVLDKNIRLGQFLGMYEAVNPALQKILKIEMVGSAKRKVQTEKPDMIIIDEAHHAAADSYVSFFMPDVAVLGLTATPKRLDDKELEFEDIVYSITARELIRRGVIIKPIIHKIPTNSRIEAFDLEKENHHFDTRHRNMFVCEKIFNARQDYKKVIVFVRAQEHAKNLTRIMRNYNERFSEDSRYEHIGFILGGDVNSGQIDNSSYLEQFRSYNRAILINCGVLTEGFDDPSVNTVIMAVPTKSIVYYLQCIGRAIRVNQGGGQGKAFIVEFEDDMPNVQYRIDNRWLFADISDELEPEILDKDYSSEATFHTVCKEIENEHSISVYDSISANAELARYEDYRAIIYNSTIGLKDDAWECLVLPPEHFSTYARIYNVLGAHVDEIRDNNADWVFETKFTFDDPLALLSEEHQRVDFLQAICLAHDEKTNGDKVSRLKYLIFNYCEEIPIELLQFVEDCENAEEVVNQFPYKYSEGYRYLIKMPIILGGFEAVYLKKPGYDFVIEYLQNLAEIKISEHWKNRAQKVLNLNNSLEQIAVAPRYFNSLSRLADCEIASVALRLN